MRQGCRRKCATTAGKRMTATRIMGGASTTATAALGMAPITLVLLRLARSIVHAKPGHTGSSAYASARTRARVC